MTLVKLANRARGKVQALSSDHVVPQAPCTPERTRMRLSPDSSESGRPGDRVAAWASTFEFSKRISQRELKGSVGVMWARIEVVPVLEAHRPDDRFPAQPTAD